MTELIKVKPCPYCGCELEWHDEEHINKNGYTVRSRYYMHPPNGCVLDLIDAPFVIGCGNSFEYAKAWNNRVPEAVSEATDLSAIRAKAIDEFAEKFKTHCDKMKNDEWNRHARPLSWENAYEQFKDEIDEIAEQLKGE